MLNVSSITSVKLAILASLSQLTLLSASHVILPTVSVVQLELKYVMPVVQVLASTQLVQLVVILAVWPTVNNVMQLPNVFNVCLVSSWIV